MRGARPPFMKVWLLLAAVGIPAACYGFLTGNGSSPVVFTRPSTFVSPHDSSSLICRQSSLSSLHAERAEDKCAALPRSASALGRSSWSVHGSSSLLAGGDVLLALQPSFNESLVVSEHHEFFLTSCDYGLHIIFAGGDSSLPLQPETNETIFACGDIFLPLQPAFNDSLVLSEYHESFQSSEKITRLINAMFGPSPKRAFYPTYYYSSDLNLPVGMFCDFKNNFFLVDWDYLLSLRE